MSRVHHPDVAATFPACTAIDDNYYVREGLYLENWDPAAFTAIAEQSFSSGETAFSIKFASRGALAEAYNALFSDSAPNNGIWGYLAGIPGVESVNGVSYSPGESEIEDPEIYALSLQFY